MINVATEFIVPISYPYDILDNIFQKWKFSVSHDSKNCNF